MSNKSSFWYQYIAPGLGSRVLGILLLMFMFALVINSFYTINGERKVLQQQMNREGNNLTQATATFAIEPLLIEDYPVLSTYTNVLMNNYPDLTDIVIKRADEKIVAQSNRAIDSSILINQYHTNVEVNETTIGYVEIGISNKHHEQFVSEHLNAMIIQSLLVFLTLAILLFIIFRKMITDPIHYLAQQAEILKDGKLDNTISLSEKGELQYLATALNKMRMNLKSSLTEIEEQNQFLDHRVAERTAALKDSNEKLIETQSQLLQSEKMAAIGQLSAGVAHEINNPLGFVSSNIEVFSKWQDDLLLLLDYYQQHFDINHEYHDVCSSKKEELDFNYIKEETPLLMKDTLEGLQRVKTIVSDLQDFAHVSEEKWQLFDLTKGIHSTLNIVNIEIKFKVDLILELQEIPEVMCIPSQINQVFLNIIVNASQSIEDKGTVTIRCYCEDDWIYVQFTDTGVGIAKNEIDKIFDPFFTTKPVGSGTGLGLSVSYGIIKAHKGKIDVKNNTGKGTTFSIMLPVYKEQTSNNNFN